MPDGRRLDSVCVVLFMEVVPLPGYILLKEEKDLPSSILVPDEADMERSNRCRVVKSSGTLFAVDEMVLIQPHLFSEVKIDGVMHLIGEEKNVIARILP